MTSGGARSAGPAPDLVRSDSSISFRTKCRPGEKRHSDAFSCMALRTQPGGYRLYWAIYVESVSTFTPSYMTLIEPFRRFVVYPAMLREIRASWAQPAR